MSKFAIGTYDIYLLKHGKHMIRDNLWADFIKN